MKPATIILIGGGDSYSKREDFLESLRTHPLRDLPQDEPYKGWKSSVVEALEGEHLVDIPIMPNKQNAKYDEWEIWFSRHLAEAADDVILIGLSLGAMFLAKYLIENVPAKNIKALFLLAGPCGYFEDETGNDCHSFGFEPSELKVIQDRVNKIVLMHSEDDFVVPYKHVDTYREFLPEAELVSFTDKNHFLVEELPELVAHIKGLED